MAEIFSDGASADFGTDPGNIPEPAVPETTVSPTAAPLPVQDQQNSLGNETDISGGTAADSGTEIPEGVEEVQDADTVDWQKYLDQLIQQHEKQNELLETLIQEDQKIDQELKNIQNAMPAVLCMLGVIIGVLLMHIFASYVRP